MCNCNQVASCNNCQQGVPCNCPPSYPVPFATVPCTCCPSGYFYAGVTQNYINGYCLDIITGIKQIGTIPCVSCEEISTTDCIIYSGQTPLTCNVSGINNGDSLTTILNKLCITSVQNIEALIQAIANSPILIAGFCNVIGNCGAIPGTTTPIIGSVTFTIP